MGSKTSMLQSLAMFCCDTQIQCTVCHKCYQAWNEHQLCGSRILRSIHPVFPYTGTASTHPASTLALLATEAHQLLLYSQSNRSELLPCSSSTEQVQGCLIGTPVLSHLQIIHTLLSLLLPLDLLCCHPFTSLSLLQPSPR